MGPYCDHCENRCFALAPCGVLVPTCDPGRAARVRRAKARLVSLVCRRWSLAADGYTEAEIGAALGSETAAVLTELAELGELTWGGGGLTRAAAE